MLQVSTGAMEEKQGRVFLREGELSCVRGRIRHGQREERHELLSLGGSPGCTQPSHPTGQAQGRGHAVSGSLAGNFGQKHN